MKNLTHSESSNKFWDKCMNIFKTLGYVYKIVDVGIDIWFLKSIPTYMNHIIYKNNKKLFIAIWSNIINIWQILP